MFQASGFLARFKKSIGLIQAETGTVSERQGRNDRRRDSSSG